MIAKNPQSANAGFIAGTLVHTDKGLVPIEKLRVGDRVLSQPEAKGELAYKRVMNTFAFEGTEVYLLMFAAQDKVGQLVATDRHPFWVNGQGWVPACMVCPGDELELSDGSCAGVFCVEPVFCTSEPDMGWVRGKYGRYNDFTGDIVDFSGGRLAFGAEDVRNEELSFDNGYLRLKRTVFGIAIEDFNTYYAGETGVRVCNANCSSEGVAPVNAKPALAFDRVDNTTRAENPGFTRVSESPMPQVDAANEFKTTGATKAGSSETGFQGDTRVLMEGGKEERIKYVAVGDKVLSRCEITGEMAYKKIIKKFLHEGSEDPNSNGEIPACYVIYSTTLPEWKGDIVGVMHAKPEQAICRTDFYKGWTTVGELRRGDSFFNSDGSQALMVEIETNHGICSIHWTQGWGALHVTPEHSVWVQGKGWTAVRDIQPDDEFQTSNGSKAIVQAVETAHGTYSVYNLHVEDFHTYFVDSGIWVHSQKNVIADKRQEAFSG